VGGTRYVAVRSEVVKESGGCGETRFGCHWLCQCSLRDVDKRFSTGRASGTQKETAGGVIVCTRWALPELLT